MSRDNPSVNRCLGDRAIDHLDHALGRPTFPLRESYRNYFATDVDSDHARAFGASPHWQHRKTVNRMAYYSVTSEGRQALAQHLGRLGLDRAYVVRFDEHDQVVPAATPAKARYSRWLEIRDCLGDMTFGAFVRRTQVWRVT
jgi:hypothetical protein